MEITIKIGAYLPEMAIEGSKRLGYVDGSIDEPKKGILNIHVVLVTICLS